MDELQVGDRVKTPGGFEPVVGFTHQSSSPSAAYIKLTTLSTEVKISAGHYIVADGAEIDPATIKVGDVVTTVHGPQPVLNVTEGFDVGAYHLMTPSGLYYTDGVLCTTYIAEVPRPVWTVLETYAYLRYLVGVPVAPDSSDGTIALDALYHVYHGKVPETVETLLTPVLVLSGLLIELYNLATLAGVTKTVSACALVISVPLSATKIGLRAL